MVVTSTGVGRLGTLQLGITIHKYRPSAYQQQRQPFKIGPVAATARGGGFWAACGKDAMIMKEADQLCPSATRQGRAFT